MKIISRILVGISLCVSIGFAGIITGISVIINNEPITLFEIYKYSKKYNISQRESLDVLIRQKLEDSQIRKLRISADSFEVDRFIENLANINSLNQHQFLDLLKSKGVDIDEYKQEVKERIKLDKLHQSIYRDKLKRVEESELKKFYKENADEFKVANRFSLVVYTSQNAEDLQAIQNNPTLEPQSVKIKNKTAVSDTLNNKLKVVLNSTNQGSFTQILNIQNTPTMFFIKEKKEFSKIPFEDVKQSIHRIISKQQKDRAVKNWLEKLKSAATIKVVRPPS